MCNLLVTVHCTVFHYCRSGNFHVIKFSFKNIFVVVTTHKNSFMYCMSILSHHLIPGSQTGMVHVEKAWKTVLSKKLAAFVAAMYIKRSGK